MASSVRPVVAPGGACTTVISAPWSSAGRKLPGSRSNKRRQAKAAEESGEYKVEKLRSPSEITKRIRQLEEKMFQHARDLEFAAAAQMRDDIQKLRQQLVNL